MDVFVDGLRVQGATPRKASPRRRPGVAKKPAARAKKKR
jgi:hypothetical protein